MVKQGSLVWKARPLRVYQVLPGCREKLALKGNKDKLVYKECKEKRDLRAKREPVVPMALKATKERKEVEENKGAVEHLGNARVSTSCQVWMGPKVRLVHLEPSESLEKWDCAVFRVKRVKLGIQVLRGNPAKPGTSGQREPKGFKGDLGFLVCPDRALRRQPLNMCAMWSALTCGIKYVRFWKRATSAARLVSLAMDIQGKEAYPGQWDRLAIQVQRV